MEVLRIVLWVVLAGVPMAINWIVTGVFWCATLVGIPIGIECFRCAWFVIYPFGLQCFRIAKLSLMPFGNTIIEQE